MDRRSICLGLLSLPGGSMLARGAASDSEALLRRGGVVLMLRHALAPGTFDPPHFKLGDCSTQRNLDDVGRAQARAIGARMRTAGLTPAKVRTSPWCRCQETAALAFGNAETWAPLGSPHAGASETNAASLKALRGALADAARRPGSFDVWVTHMFVMAALVADDTASGEGLVIGLGDREGVQVLGRWATV